MSFLPGTGRGTATRSGVVEGAHLSMLHWEDPPSTILRMVPLPVPGRNFMSAKTQNQPQYYSPLPRSRATFGSRSNRSICPPSSKLSSIRNLSFAAYFIFTRRATSR